MENILSISEGGKEEGNVSEGKEREKWKFQDKQQC